MKKLLFVFMIAALLVQGVWSDGDPRQAKVSDISGEVFGEGTNRNVYYFSGFDFNNYQDTDPSLVDLNTGERTFIVDESAGGTYSILGHSQGGLRALGYITQLEKNLGNPNLIDAVITTSAIDQGLKMLEGDIPAFKGRVTEKINIIGNGLRAGYGLFDIFNQHAIPRNYLGNILGQNREASAFLLGLLPGTMSVYMKEAWINEDVRDGSQIDSMIPASAYIRENVIQSESHPYRRQTGSRTVFAGWGYQTLFWGIRIPIPTWRTEPVYTYYTRTAMVPKFDHSVPVGFIVGTDSNTLGMNKEKEAEVRGWVDGFEIGFAVAEGLHIAKCVYILGFFTNSIQYAQDADRARQFCENIDAEINDIKGSPENDGLVAKSSQYLPSTYINPYTGWPESLTVLSVEGRIGYYPINDNHMEMGADNSEVRRVTGLMIEEGERKRGRR